MFLYVTAILIKAFLYLKNNTLAFPIFDLFALPAKSPFITRFKWTQILWNPNSKQV